MPASTDYSQNPMHPRVLQEPQHELALTILFYTSSSLGAWQVWSILGALAGQDPYTSAHQEPGKTYYPQAQTSHVQDQKNT